MKTIFVLVDACKSSYVTEEYMPFLHNLTKEGKYIDKIYPSPGFCERSEIFSGLDCFETGNFSAIGWLPEYSDYKNMKFTLGLYEFLSKINDRGARAVFRRTKPGKSIPLKTYRIPFESLKYFSLTEDGRRKIIEHEDIFDILKIEGKSYSDRCFTSLAFHKNVSEQKLAEAIFKEIKKNTYFIPAYIGSIDYRGHDFGDDMELMQPHLLKVDQILSEIYSLAMRNGYVMTVLGDHGMVPVKEKVDIAGSIKNLGYILHKDYEMFLDSTYARFWSGNQDIIKKIKQFVSEKYNEKGIVINEYTCFDRGIPIDLCADDGHGIYGDILWCANPGVIISPDFFNDPNKTIRGMHGYFATDKEHGAGMFVAAGAGILNRMQNSAQLKDICGELCKLLEIRFPNYPGWSREVKRI